MQKKLAKPNIEDVMKPHQGPCWVKQGLEFGALTLRITSTGRLIPQRDEGGGMRDHLWVISELCTFII